MSRSVPGRSSVAAGSGDDVPHLLQQLLSAQCETRSVLRQAVAEIASLRATVAELRASRPQPAPKPLTRDKVARLERILPAVAAVQKDWFTTTGMFAQRFEEPGLVIALEGESAKGLGHLLGAAADSGVPVGRLVVERGSLESRGQVWRIREVV